MEGMLAPSPSPDQQSAIPVDIAQAPRAAFPVMPVFMTAHFSRALTNPLRRI
jgi:hypothetical protein